MRSKSLKTILKHGIGRKLIKHVRSTLVWIGKAANAILVGCADNGAGAVECQRIAKEITGGLGVIEQCDGRCIDQPAGKRLVWIDSVKTFFEKMTG